MLREEKAVALPTDSRSVVAVIKQRISCCNYPAAKNQLFQRSHKEPADCVSYTKRRSAVATINRRPNCWNIESAVATITISVSPYNYHTGQLLQQSTEDSTVGIMLQRVRRYSYHIQSQISTTITEKVNSCSCHNQLLQVTLAVITDNQLLQVSPVQPAVATITQRVGSIITQRISCCRYYTYQLLQLSPRASAVAAITKRVSCRNYDQKKVRCLNDHVQKQLLQLSPEEATAAILAHRISGC